MLITRHPVAAIAVVLVCGLLAVELVSEMNHPSIRSEEIVREDASPQKNKNFPDLTAAAEEKQETKDEATQANWESRARKAGDAKSVIKNAESTAAKATAKKFADLESKSKLAAAKQHETNSIARKEMRKAATESADSQVRAAVNGMKAQVKSMAANAAKLAAKSISKNAQFSKANGAAERKMKLLERDVILLLAAKKKSIHAAAVARANFKAKNDHYKQMVKVKMARANADLLAIQKKLGGYQVVKNTEKLTSIQMHKMAQHVIQLSDTLKSKHRRIARLARKRVRIQKREHKRQKRVQKRLKKLKKKYSRALKDKKHELYELQHSPDISEQMAAKIASTRHRVKQQIKTMNHIEDDTEHTNSALQNALHTQKLLQTRARKRQAVLGVANKAYARLATAVSRLRKIAAQRDAAVVIKGPHGDDAVSAKKATTQVKISIKAAAKRSKETFQKSITKAAKKAAASEADSVDKKKIMGETKQEVEPLVVNDEVETEHHDRVASLSKDPALMAAASKLLRRTKRI